MDFLFPPFDNFFLVVSNFAMLLWITNFIAPLTVSVIQRSYTSHNSPLCIPKLFLTKQHYISGACLQCIRDKYSA